MGSSPSFDDVLRAAIRDEMEAALGRALDEQRQLLAPLQAVAERLRDRATLTIADTAALLGVSESTVRRWLRTGELVDTGLSGDRRLIGADQILDILARAKARRRNCGEAPQ
jgi:excisionase family DNA binding protein